MQPWHIGVDEAGRGPLAGPVAVGVVLVPTDFDWSLLSGVGDSKKVSEKNRERIYTDALILAKQGQLWCTVEMGNAKAIDNRGIAVVIRECIDKGLKTVAADCNGTLHPRNELTPGTPMSKHHTPFKWSMVAVKLDGLLKAPDYCVHQETIIKGDAKEKVIGLASILAKVTRDAYMRRLATRPAFFHYQFARHKGYGTAAHRRAIMLHGLSTEHRTTFCKKVKNVA